MKPRQVAFGPDVSLLGDQDAAGGMDCFSPFCDESHKCYLLAADDSFRALYPAYMLLLLSEKLRLDVMGFVLADPVTFLTDLTLAMVCFHLGRRLRDQFTDRHSYSAYLFFVFLGMSTFVGGFSHLLDEYLGKGPHLVAWLINGVSVAMAQFGALLLVRSRRRQVALLVGVAVQYLAFAAMVVSTADFFWVKLNSAFGLLGVVTLIHFLNFNRRRNFVFLALPMAILGMTVPLLTHSLDLELNAVVNKNVIAHLLLAPCFYGLYVAYRKLGETLAAE